MPDFVHLEVYTEYSLLSSMVRLEELCIAAKELGFKSIAVTDKGNLFAAPEFFELANKHGIKAILGISIKVGAEPVLLYVKDRTGYKNLSILVSSSYRASEDNPRISLNSLLAHREGLIAVSGLEETSLSMHIQGGDFESAYRNISELKEAFGPDFYLKISRMNDASSERLFERKIEFAEKYGLNLVASNPVYAIKKEDQSYLDYLLAIKTNVRLADLPHSEHVSRENYLKSAGEMKELFIHVPEALKNSSLIAEKVSFDFDIGTWHFPDFELGIHEKAPSDKPAYLKRLCTEGLERRYGFSYYDEDLEEVRNNIKKRLDYELGAIKDMGYSDYFLITWDFVSYAKKHGILVGPGRGSGAGSLVCYLLGITDIDPIKHKLIFERFLNPGRISMPDLDIDFQDDRRGEVIDYVFEKYGRSRVAHIITFGTLGARQVIRDVGKALSLDQNLLDGMAKAIPGIPNITLDAALKESGSFKSLTLRTREAAKVLEVSRKLEGLPRNTSVHAAGVVIAGEEFQNIHPTIVQSGQVLTQYEMKQIERIGMLKMDFLGLRYLSIISGCLREIERVRGEKLDLDKIPDDDKKTYYMLSKGFSQGVFQLESPGMIGFLTKLKPRCFEDIVVGIALYRPGPMDSIPKFLNGRKNSSAINYHHSILKPILKETSGCIVYQEQVMEIVRTIGGFTYSEADNIRRAMSKKKMDVMQDYRLKFIEGGLKQDTPSKIGLNETILNKIYDEMIDFANYAFNKSHAVSYALVAYRTAYLKANYTGEYMAQLLSSTGGASSAYSLEKVAKYVDEAKKFGIEVLAPSVSKSGVNFRVEGKSIRYGLLSIKNISKRLAEEIEKIQREGGAKDVIDFYKRLPANLMNKKANENLILSGALDEFGIDPAVLLNNYDRLNSHLHGGKYYRSDNQISLLDMSPELGIGLDFEFEPSPSFDKAYVRDMRTEILGTLNLIFHNEERETVEIYIEMPSFDDVEFAYIKSFKTSENGVKLYIRDLKSAKVFLYNERIALNLEVERALRLRYGEENVKFKSIYS